MKKSNTFKVLFAIIIFCCFLNVKAATTGSWLDEGNYSVTWFTEDTDYTSTGDGKYYINNEKDLAGLAYIVNYNSSNGINYAKVFTKEIVIEKDLDLSAHYWVPIQALVNVTLNGNNNSIKGIYINETLSNVSLPLYYGFIRNIMQSTIKNINLYGTFTFNFTGGNNDSKNIYIGGLVGNSVNNTISNINNNINITINGKALQKCYYIGGIAGYMQNGASSKTLIDSSNNGDITLDIDNPTPANDLLSKVCIGGLVGNITGEKIINSYNTGKLLIDTPDSGYEMIIGGLVGYTSNSYAVNDEYNNIIINSYNSGNIRNTSNTSNRIGGIVGSATGDNYLNNIVNSGEILNISGTDNKIFPLAPLSVNINNSYYSNNLTGNGTKITTKENLYNTLNSKKSELNTFLSDNNISNVTIKDWFQYSSINSGYPVLESHKFNVTIDENIVGGTISVNKENNNEVGDSMTLTVTPNQGYILTQISGINLSDNTKSVNISKDYKFTMPDYNVNITATFVKYTKVTGIRFNKQNLQDITFDAGKYAKQLYTLGYKLKDSNGNYINITGNVVGNQNDLSEYFSYDSATSKYTFKSDFLKSLNVSTYVFKYVGNNDSQIIEVEFEIIDRTYAVIEGADQVKTIKINEEGARFRIDAEYSLFDKKVYIDNDLVDEKNYISESGSTIIIFKTSFLDNLSVGNHTLKVVFSDGGISNTAFTIKEKDPDPVVDPVVTDPVITDSVVEDPVVNTPIIEPTQSNKITEKNNNPKTYDGIMISIKVCIFSLIGLILSTLYLKRFK